MHIQQDKINALGQLYDQQFHSQHTRFSALCQFYEQHTHTAQMQATLKQTDDPVLAMALLCVLMHQHARQLRKLRKHTRNPSELVAKRDAILSYYCNQLHFIQ